jgi:hypothetical protein
LRQREREPVEVFHVLPVGADVAVRARRVQRSFHG